MGSSPSDSAMYTGEWEYDVFLCFRGDDTRHGITSHLMAALTDKKIKVFNDTLLPKTESIDELLSVLQRSALSIVIFSENFADSSWCLDEVATIARSMEKFEHRALPVFYKVGWPDVAGDSGRYSALIDGELKASSEDNNRWKDALRTVANRAGHTSSAIPIESELIKAIVEDVQKQLIDMSPSIKSENLVGMGSRVLEVEQLLAMDEQDDTRIIGIWGMGGLGKTTLAKACYERVVSSKKDTKYHFIRNINQICENQQGINGIVHELYSKVLSESNLSREDLDMHYRRARISHSRVFIVLDDVDTPRQLQQILLSDDFKLPKLFAAGSRIIVTTRNKKVLRSAVAKEYGIEGLNDDESIQLFCSHAFRQHRPPASWMHLTSRATSCCKGNPLALRVLGGTLFGEDREYWEIFLGGLSLIQDHEIVDILRRSFDKMGHEEKRLFLDVACFLHGISKSQMIGYLATIYSSAYVTVKDLIYKSLLICVSEKDGDNIEVHDLLKKMAWNIVNEESKLGKRSRLMDLDDIYKVLATTKVESWTTFYIYRFFKRIGMMVRPGRKRSKVNDMHQKHNCGLEGLRTTEGISLNLSKTKEMRLEANAFKGMDSLTFLKFSWPLETKPYRSKMDIAQKKKIYLPYGGLDSLPDGLRWLQWDGYPSKSLPSGFYPQHLVRLIIRCSPIKKCWEGYDQVFIVLDDVDTPRQLQQILSSDDFKLSKLFAVGSRIIVTTRNKKVLQSAMAKKYGIEGLNNDESIQLFSSHAFRQYPPLASWMHLSSRATSCCKGNPWALRVLGCALFRENKDYWESFLDGLNLIENQEIGDILRRSYDKIGPKEKRLFLDVACFLHGISRSQIIGYLATIYSSAYVKVKDLIDKSLLICVSEKDGENIEVHDLLKKMAWNIVNEESKLGKRSRLMDPDDIYKLLATTKVESWTTFYIYRFFKHIGMMVRPGRKRSKVIDMHQKHNCGLEGLRTTEGISLDLSKTKEMHLEANAFRGMDSLTFLKFSLSLDTEPYGSKMDMAKKKKIHLPNYGLDSLLDGLRWLQWDVYPSKSLPSGVYSQHLVRLIIRCSPIKKCWEGYDQPKLVNLMVLDLSWCLNLTAIPDLSCSLQLEELLLGECKSLVEVPSHVQYLDKLITLDLGRCINLQRLPLKLNSKRLKHVRINYCHKVKYCPEFSSRELMELDLNGTRIRELPNAIYHVKEGGELRLFGEHITNCPEISASLREFVLMNTAVKEMISYDNRHHASSQLLPKFETLGLFGNSQLESLPKSIWNMVSSIPYITDGPLLESLPEVSEHVSILKRLWITNCEGLKSLPSSINKLVSLNFLSLSNTGIKSLPSSIHELPALGTLWLRGCESVVALPELPSSLYDLDVSGCKSLQALPSNTTKLRWSRLVFYDCPQLDRMLPDEIVAKYSVYTASSESSSKLRYELGYSGTEIPEWFAYRSVNDKDSSCLTVQLPPATCTGSQKLIKGIAFGMVWSSNAVPCWPIVECKCDFGTITVASWRCKDLSLFAWCGTSSSDQVTLWFDEKLSSGETEEILEGGGEEAWHVKYAGHTVSFRFYPHFTLGGNVEHYKKNFKIRRCGISLLY